jgi:hypothetical protein
MSKVFRMLLLATAMVIVGGVAALAVGSSDPIDISGPCDEAEHANDPRCSGVVGGRAERDDGAGQDVLGDISGPCDEAEHANDPRCTGTDPVEGDNSGPGDGGNGENADGDSSGPGDGDDADDDTSGPSDNSGPGSGGDDHDDSGPGSGGDDHDDSGPGSGGDDHDDSGPGSGNEG